MKYIKYYNELIKKEINVEIPLPSDILEISNIFIKNGYDIFVVGGAIRDFLIKKQPHDYDLVTNAQPNAIKTLLHNKYRLGLHGQHFAVIRVYTKETPDGIEIASYRKDISKGRDNKISTEPKVEFGHHITINDDVMRRDFTCNALYYNIKDKKIVDVVGGIDDIKNGIIKSVGNPRNRFREDRLRILRTFRFAARTNSKIDSSTSEAIKLDNRLNGISIYDDVTQERINDEFYSMLEWSYINNDIEAWLRYLNLLKEYKMFVRMYPGVVISTKFKKTFNDIIIFANLFINNNVNEKLYNKIHDDFKLQNRVIHGLIYLIKLFNLLNDDNIEKIYNPDNKNNIYNMYLKKTDINIDDETIFDFLILNKVKKHYINVFLEYHITTSSKSVVDMGFKGKEIGEELRKIECKKFKKML